MVPALLSVIVALGAVLVLLDRARTAKRADAGYTPPWVQGAVQVRSGFQWLWRLVLRLFRRTEQPEEVKLSPVSDSLSVRWAVEKNPTNVSEWLELLKARTERLSERIGNVEREMREADDRLRRELKAGDRSILVQTLGPSWTDCLVAALAVIASIAQVLALAP